jgi:hypothetical protein
MSDPKRELLRHALATLSYRASKALRDAPEGFESTRAAADTRRADEIVAHMGDLMEWAASLAEAKQAWKAGPREGWDTEVSRFFAAVRRLDDLLATGAVLGASPEAIFQGPIADALTHVGQIATLRRLAGSAVKGENYFRAEITVGRVGADQADPRLEFE